MDNRRAVVLAALVAACRGSTGEVASRVLPETPRELYVRLMAEDANAVEERGQLAKEFGQEPNPDSFMSDFDRVLEDIPEDKRPSVDQVFVGADYRRVPDASWQLAPNGGALILVSPALVLEFGSWAAAIVLLGANPDGGGLSHRVVTSFEDLRRESLRPDFRALKGDLKLATAAARLQRSCVDFVLLAEYIAVQSNDAKIQGTSWHRQDVDLRRVASLWIAPLLKERPRGKPNEKFDRRLAATILTLVLKFAQDGEASWTKVSKNSIEAVDELVDLRRIDAADYPATSSTVRALTQVLRALVENDGRRRAEFLAAHRARDQGLKDHLVARNAEFFAGWAKDLSDAAATRQSETADAGAGSPDTPVPLPATAKEGRQARAEDLWRLAAEVARTIHRVHKQQGRSAPDATAGP